MIGELTKDQIENILQSQAHCRIACTDGLMPYLVPVSYAYDGKYIYCQSKEGKKLTILRKNPNVCVQVETMSSMNNWQSVIVYGTFEELENEDAIKARKFLFSNVLTLMTSAAIHSFQHNNVNEIKDDNRIKDIMFRVKINEVTGRYEK
jgi:nitroimidazol reductase NimA-like FMN-containing flavoprotein (pyridoxamine 5'-phosphate oxidase superfamily)